MNIRELLVPLFFALIIAFSFQYYLSRKVSGSQEASVSGQIYDVKHEPEVAAPLKWSVDFVDSEDKDADLVQLETKYALMTFSSAGAILDKMQFKHRKEVLTDIGMVNREQKAFLVAFDEKTPFYYQLHEQSETEAAFVVHYKRQFEDGSISKIFTIDKQVPKIDLTIELSGHDYSHLKRVRIFYPAPHVVNDKVIDVTAFINDVQNAAQLKRYTKVNEIIHKTWRKPTVFGLADRFFVHAMVKDQNDFIYRGAFNVFDDIHLQAQLESHQLTKDGVWRVTFYVGPKQAHIMGDVDPRLEQLLDYGILSPIVKIVLLILNFFYKYVKNYGLAIILLTVLIRLLLLPLTIKGQRGMDQVMKNQAELQKKIQYLKQKYSDDPERFRQEQAELVRKHGMGGVSGCLPVLLQFPIFIVLNRLLSSAIELYHASFLWIPNLSAPDPYYILPIIFGIGFLISMLAQKKQQKQPPFMMYGLALFLGATMTGFASGVVLFIISSMYLGVLENWLARRVK